MFTAKFLRAAAILSMLALPAFSYAADQPPPPAGAPAPAPAPEGPKPLSPGLLGLEPIVGPVDDAVDNAKAAISKSIGIDVSGFLDVGYQYASTHPHSSSSISGRYFDKDHNKVVFNAFNLTVDKAEKDWGVGFHISADFGRAGELLREATLWGPKLHQEPWAELREAFLTFTIPVGEGLAVKAGKFVTPLGTEILPAPGNYNNNISRSFAFNFGVPLTHLGTLFTYPFVKTFSASAGLVTGWDDPADNNDVPTFLGGINWTPSDNFAFTSNGTIGKEWSAPGIGKTIHNGGTRFVVSNVATIKADPWTTFLEYTFGHEHHALTPKASRDAWWHALAGIVSYDWTDRFNTSLRGEGFLDPQGARTGGLNATTPTNHVSLAEMTLTGAYKFTAKLLGRVEVREDIANKSVFKRGGSSADKDQTTFALQGIYTF